MFWSRCATVANNWPHTLHALYHDEGESRRATSRAYRFARDIVVKHEHDHMASSRCRCSSLALSLTQVTWSLRHYRPPPLVTYIPYPLVVPDSTFVDRILPARCSTPHCLLATPFEFRFRFSCIGQNRRFAAEEHVSAGTTSLHELVGAQALYRRLQRRRMMLQRAKRKPFLGPYKATTLSCAASVRPAGDICKRCAMCVIWRL